MGQDDVALELHRRREELKDQLPELDGTQKIGYSIQKRVMRVLKALAKINDRSAVSVLEERVLYSMSDAEFNAVLEVIDAEDLEKCDREVEGNA